MLRLLFWEITAGCNLDCMHCRRLNVSKQAMKSDMSTVKSLQFISNLVAFAKPILVLSGGDPWAAGPVCYLTDEEIGQAANEEVEVVP